MDGSAREEQAATRSRQLAVEASERPRFLCKLHLFVIDAVLQADNRSDHPDARLQHRQWRPASAYHPPPLPRQRLFPLHRLLHRLIPVALHRHAGQPLWRQIQRAQLPKARQNVQSVLHAGQLIHFLVDPGPHPRGGVQPRQDVDSGRIHRRNPRIRRSPPELYNHGLNHHSQPLRLLQQELQSAATLFTGGAAADNCVAGGAADALHH